MPNGGSSPESLEVARRESRAVLKQQLETGRSTRAEIARSTRTAVLVLAVLIAAAGVVGAERLARLNAIALILFTLGALLLILCPVLGYLNVTASTYRFGIGDELRESAKNRDLRSEYLKDILDGYDGWTREMTVENERMGQYLEWVQLSLISGVVVIIIGGGVILYGSIL